MSEQIDGVDIENTTEDANLDLATETAEETVDSEESIEDLRAHLDEERQERAKSDKAFNDQKIRAEKAERQLKSQPKIQSEAKDLTSKDTIAIIQAGIHQDDIDDVVDYAKFKNMSVSDALKSSVIKATLSQKAEFRTTAEATNTGKTRSGSAKLSGEALLQKARTGEMPKESDLYALVEARYESKK